MGVFGKTEQAQVTGKSGYFPPGKHRVCLRLVKVHTGNKGTNCIIEATCLETDSSLDSLGDGQTLLKPGQTRAQVIPMNPKDTMGPVNVKAFVLAVSGFEPTDPEGAQKAIDLWSNVLGQKLTFEEVCERIFNEKAPLVTGHVMDLECVNIITKEKKLPFTVHNWRAWGGETGEVESEEG
jgi:hypothetical protein